MTHYQAGDHLYDFSSDHPLDESGLSESHELTLKQLSDEGEVAMLRGEYERAIHVWDMALTLEHANSHVLLQKAICFYHLQRIDESNMYLNASLISDPNNKQAKKWKVSLALKSSDSSAALDLLPENPTNEDDDSKLYRAVILNSLKRYDEALKVLKSINHSSVVSNSSEYYFSRAKAFYGIHEYGPSFIHISQAIKILPQQFPYHLLRASITLELFQSFAKEFVLRTKRRTSGRLAIAIGSASLSPLKASNSIPLSSSTAAPTNQSTSSITSSPPLTTSQKLAKSNFSINPLAASSAAYAARQPQLPPLDEMLAIGMSDIEICTKLQPNSLQTLAKRAALLGILRKDEEAADVYRQTLNHPLLHSSERSRIILRLGTTLNNIGTLECLKEAHSIYSHELAKWTPPPLDILDADVRTLVAIGTEVELLESLQLVEDTFAAIKTASMKAVLILMKAKICKRLDELNSLNQTASSKDLQTSIASISTASSSLSSQHLHSQQQSSTTASQIMIIDRRKEFMNYIEEAIAILNDPSILTQEAIFWKQSGESDISLKLAIAAAQKSKPPMDTAAKILVAGEYLSRGENALALKTLAPIPTGVAKSDLYKILASHIITFPLDKNVVKLQIDQLDSFLTDLSAAAQGQSSLAFNDMESVWVTATFHKARLLRIIEEYDQALEAFEAVLRVTEDHPAALLHVAEILYRQQEYNLASEYYLKRLGSVYDKQGRIFITLQIARCHFFLKDFIGTIEATNRVLEIDPFNSEAKSWKQQAESLNSNVGYVTSFFNAAVTPYLPKLNSWFRK